MNRRLAATAPENAIPGAIDGEAEKKLRQIATILGVTDPTNADAITAAFNALWAPGGETSGEEAVAAAKLSASERKAVASTPGCTARAFLAAKNCFGGAKR